MNVVADNFDRDGRGIEVFILQFTDAAAVDGIGPLRVKSFHVEVLRALADLFVRRKGHADITMRDIFALQHRQRGHDLRDTRLVIRPQQRFTVGGDQRLAQQLVQHGEHHRREHLVANAQRNVAAAVVFHNLRVHMFTAKIRRGVDMGDKANRRNITLDIRRQRCHHSAFFA